MVSDDDNDTFQNIGYLSAINQSPTSHDTVLELLSQSKLKAEKLGLTETDVVLDMAIYSKAVEILINPRYIDLKRFVVLRVGAFHIMCIFIAVIGKRFGDAVLRDIVIESNLLGESSVEQMLKGKHYNNAMRVLNYLYDALKRRLIESFEQSLLERTGHLEINYEEFIESAELQRFVSSLTKESLKALSDGHSEVIAQIHTYESLLLTGVLGPTACVWVSFLQNDIAVKRIAHDKECALRSYDLIKDWGSSFKENNRLIHISSGVECSPNVECDMINAEKKGKEAMVNFIEKRIESNEEHLYVPIPKMKLKTFASMKIKKSCSVKEKSLTLKADRDIFARLLVICGKREVSLKEVVTYSLGPIPWSLATADGSFSKMVKSKLLDAIEKDVDNPMVNELPNNCARVFDGMVIIQQLPSLSLATFGEISEYVLKRITSHPSKVVYFVTDEYRDDSIKGSEQKRRASAGTICIQLNRRDQKQPKQLKKYLSDGCNKIDLVKFFLNDWSDPEGFKAMIGDRVIVLTLEGTAYRLQVISNRVSSTPEKTLSSNQEEADTKMFLCCQHAVHQFFSENVCISTVDSDVGVLAIYYKDRIRCNLFVEIGSRSKRRILSISLISENIGKEMSDALPALHAVSGCDSTSSFHRIGKQRMYKVVKSADRFKAALVQMGDTFDLDMDHFPALQEMIAQCYGIKGCDNINDAR